MTDSNEKPTIDKRAEEGHGSFRPVAELISSLRFLTRIPVPFSRTVEYVPLAQAMRMFCVAGAMIGAAIALVLVILQSLHVPNLVAAALTFALSLLLTGALHEDGFADVMDGFGGGKTRERRLEIMHDSRIGSYGTLGLISIAALKVTSFASLSALSPLVVLAILASAAAFSRALVVDLMWATLPARQDGLSAMVGRPSRDIAIFNILIAGIGLVGAGLLMHQALSGVIALAAALAVTAIARRLAMKLIGGQTGDVCGAVQVASEVAILIVFASSIH